MGELEKPKFVAPPYKKKKGHSNTGKELKKPESKRD